MSVAQDPSENTRVAAEASSSTESLDVQTGTPQAAVKQQEDALEQRAQRRKERWEKNHALAEEHNKAVRYTFTFQLEVALIESIFRAMNCFRRMIMPAQLHNISMPHNFGRQIRGTTLILPTHT